MKFFNDIERANAVLNSSKLKGRTKIILTDVRTGKEEIHEDENMVTDAVQKIFQSNFLGVINNSEMIPMTSLFNGIFLFRDALTESAGNIFPSADNPMTANAGPTAHSTNSRTRGNPVGAASEVGTNYIKNVWLWDLEQGNGTISAVSLTSGAAGDCGLYPDGTLPLLKTLGVGYDGKNSNSCYVIGSTLDRDRAMTMPMSIKSNGDGLSCWVNGTSFEEITVRHSFIKVGLIYGMANQPSSEFYEVSNRTATLGRSYDRAYCQIGQDADYYYIFERDSSDNTKLWFDKVSKTDMTVTSGSLTISGATLARTSSPDSTASGGTLLFNAIVSNGSVYWVSGSDAKTFVRINISNSADITVLDSDMTANVKPDMMPVVLGNALVIGRNFMINGTKVYPTAERTARTLTSGSELRGSETMAVYDSPVFYQYGYYRHNNTYEYLSSGGVMALPYLATINNLETPVVKNNTRTMRVEYELITL